MELSEEKKRIDGEDPEKVMARYKQTGDPQIRNKLVLYYSYIAKSVAAEMMGTFRKYASVEEMVNQGVIALIDSIDRFEPAQGVKFSTYAFTRVRGAIIDYVRSQDWLPRRVRRNVISFNNTYDQLGKQLGRNPTKAEMAAQMGMSMEEFERCSYEVSGEMVYSFEDVLQTYTQLHNVLWTSMHTEDDPEGRMDEEELHSQLMEAIDELSDQERLVLSLYYYENLTMKEIGSVLGVSEQRVGQVNRKLILKLREKMNRYLNG